MTTLFAIGFLSAFLSSLSGAGAALFATPLLLSLGINLPTVLACNQLCAAMWTPIASRNYRRGESLDMPLVLAVAAVGCVGAYYGYSMAIRMPVERMKPLIGALILLVVSVVWFRPATERKAPTPSARARIVAIMFGFPLGAYQAFFGGGNTLFSSLMFSRTRGFDFRHALAHSYSVAFVWCSLSALLFWFGGWIDWRIASPAMLGSVAGAFLGSTYGSKLSSAALRRVFLLVGAAMGCKLLFGS
jgi:uncharacterized membrane protein YfcA